MIERYTHREVADIWSDESKFKRWLDVELAVCDALAELGKIPSASAKNMRKNSKVNIKKIRDLENTTKHEVVAFVNSVVEQIEEDGCYFHFGVTSSDVMDTSFSIMLRDALNVVVKELDVLSAEVRSKALKFKGLACVGRTHGIHAEPMSFGLKFVSWYDELKRCKIRLQSAKENASVCMVSGAVGTYSALDPKVEQLVAKKLKLKTLGITTQVIPRDVYADVFNSLALTGACVERIALELRHLQRTEVMEVLEEFTKGQTGSSAMPHKRNPISAENLTGCARMLRGYAGVAVENIALWHERDISHSSAERIIGPDATILTAYMLKRLTGILSRLKISEKDVEKNLNLTHGLVYSSHVLVALMEKGVKRDDAYEIVQKSSMKLWDMMEKGDCRTSFMDVLKRDKKVVGLLGDKGLRDIFDKKNVLRHVDLIYKKVL
ncbi:MAG: adenylosuccinate lyase [Pseudomonadota bacterium]